jgi:hypothetical protein
MKDGKTLTLFKVLEAANFDISYVLLIAVIINSSHKSVSFLPCHLHLKGKD